MAARLLYRSLSPQLQLGIRRALGRTKPWDPGEPGTPPQCGPGMHAAPPDFVGVGVQKAGTSRWYSLLARHPDIHNAPAHKERHFFKDFWREPFTDASVRDYASWFPRPEGRLCGEWTPVYIIQPWAPPLLKRAAPDTRILVLLRDPVERLRSGLAHLAARSWIVDHRRAMEQFSIGLYAPQLERLFESFPREQVLVQTMERCNVDAPGELRRTHLFLGLEPHPPPTEPLERRFHGSRQPKIELPPAMLDAITDAYRQDARHLDSLGLDLDFDLWPTVRP
ncbi:MAG: sulfotransferase domain-containing protein [Myxococcales bacterium]|nr:sulfotransferase domain-containing protein [Myxococcales bacterium]